MAEIEQTLVLFKPDTLQRGIVGEILSRFEKVGLKIVGLKMLDARDEQLAKHYYKDEEWLIKKGKTMIEKKGYSADHDPKAAGQEIVDGLMKDMKITPIIALALEGHNAVMTVKRLAGPTNIDEAAPGTIRGDFSHDTFGLANISNRPNLTIIHATDNPAEAENELGIWFNPSEIHSYSKIDEKIHHRKFE